MKINIFKILKKKNSIRNFFPVSGFLSLEIKEPIYPLFISMEKSDLYAYSARFMIKSESLPEIEKLIERFFHKANIQEKECLHHYDKTLCFYRFDEFNFLVVDMITNDIDFIAEMNNFKLEPPSPDRVFPHVNFDVYGSLQGELALWWDVYWEPFWNSLAEKRRNEYIEKSSLSLQTISFLARHQRQ